MGLIGDFINKIKGKNKDLNKNTTDLLTLFSPYFSGGQSPELNTTFVAGVNTNAKHISRARVMCRQGDNIAKDKGYLNRLLEIAPNPLMTAPVFWKAMATNYYMNNLALAYIEWNYSDYKEPIKAIYPLDYEKNSLEFRVSPKGEMFISFLLGGRKHTASLEDLIVLTREVSPETLPFGQRSVAINTVLKVIQANYEGIEQSIRTSAFIRFLVTSTTPLSDLVKKEKAEYFANTYLGKDSSGVVYIDQAQQVTQVNSTGTYAKHEETKDLKNDILMYLGINEKIIKAEYNEEEWQAYHESIIEPFFNEVEAEFSQKLLTKEELENDYRMRVETSKLHSASMKTRKEIALAYMTLPVYKPNTVCDLLYLPRLLEGDKEFSNLNYVNAGIQDEYQLSKAKQNEKVEVEDE